MPVNSQHPDYKKFLPKWERCRDVAAGEDAVHEAGSKYLPMLKQQQNDDYLAYVQRAPFYNATWRTIAGLTGMLFRKPPKVEVPAQLNDQLKNIDGEGMPFTVLAEAVAEETLKQGRIAILVDYPPVPAGYTKADELRLGLQPTMATYDTFSVINWKIEVVNGKRTLVQLVLEEKAWVAEDEYTGAYEDRWRVLDLEGVPTGSRQYRVRVFRQSKAAGKSTSSQTAAVATFEQVGDTVYPTMQGKNLDYIPVVILGTDDISTDVDDPPLIDLVNMNLSHYRTTADHEHGCHFTALPTLVLTGWKKENPGDKVYLGSESALVTSNDAAKATFCEFSGAGLESLAKNLDRKEQAMAVLGARMLEPQRKGVEAPETAAIHRKGEESMLSNAAQAISLGLTQALKWWVAWAGADPKDVLVELNRDFYPAPMSPQMLTALIMGWQSGVPGLSDQGIFTQLQQAELVDEDVSLEDEQARIAARQAQLAALSDSMGTPDPNAPDPNAPPAAPPAKSGDIHIHMPKASGKRTVTGPNGAKYTMTDE